MLSEFQLAWGKMHLAWFEIDLAYLLYFMPHKAA